KPRSRTTSREGPATRPEADRRRLVRVAPCRAVEGSWERAPGTDPPGAPRPAAGRVPRASGSIPASSWARRALSRPRSSSPRSFLRIVENPPPPADRKRGANGDSIGDLPDSLLQQAQPCGHLESVPKAPEGRHNIAWGVSPRTADDESNLSLSYPRRS